MNLLLLTTKMKQKYPVLRVPGTVNEQRAAVLIILYPRRGRTHTLLIKRAKRLEVHAGEMAFPGGLFQEEDNDMMTTALRETMEELNLEISERKIIGRLSTVTTRTEFEVTPFVAQLDIQPYFKGNRNEVEEVLEVPLVALLSTQQRDVGYKPAEEMYVFWFKNHRIWGATARILHEICELSMHKSR